MDARENPAQIPSPYLDGDRSSHLGTLSGIADELRAATHRAEFLQADPLQSARAHKELSTVTPSSSVLVRPWQNSLTLSRHIPQHAAWKQRAKMAFGNLICERCGPAGAQKRVC